MQAAIERRRLETVIRKIPAGVILVDAPSGTVTIANPEAERILGRSISGAPIEAAWSPDQILDLEGRPLPPPPTTEQLNLDLSDPMARRAPVGGN